MSPHFIFFSAPGKRRCSETFPKGYFNRLPSVAENGHVPSASKSKLPQRITRRQSISTADLQIHTVKDSYLQTVFNRIKDFVTDTKLNINFGRSRTIHRSDSMYSRMEEGILEQEKETKLYPVTEKCVIVSECSESKYKKAFDPIWKLLKKIKLSF